jgi:hypothetical protein
MSTISNRFYVTAIDDGTTLHGNLASDKSLTQAWNGSSAVPNWTAPSEQPTIYLTLLSGATLVKPADGYKWYYNGAEITASDTRFQITTKSVTYAGQTIADMPALKIVANLASSANVDVDMITFKGDYVINGTGVSFACDAQIRISAITANGKLGVINFVGGISDITEAGQTITMYGRLYGSDGQSDTSATTKWYLNDSSIPVSGQTIDGQTNAFQVTESQVVDHATVRCEFYDANNNLLYTAYAGIDDMQDPEIMYIQYNGNNGNAASLRRGETASFQIWVGKRDDAGVLGGASNPTYPIIKVLLLDGNGSVITASGLATNIPDPDSNGYRTLPMSGGKGSITPHYDTVNGAGKKNLTGIVIAYTS